MTSLLFHISYYSNPQKRLDHKNNRNKSSEEYCNFVIKNIKTMLNETEII